MSLWKKFQRVGKKAVKFHFVITYEKLCIEYDTKWVPNSVCIIWCRGNRKIKSQWRKWEPTIENPFKGIVEWPIPESFEFDATLYRDIKNPQTFEEKEWNIFVEDKNLSDTHHHAKRHRIAASAVLALNNFVGNNCGLDQKESSVRLPIRPNGKRCKEAVLHFQISCSFIKEGKATDDDMQSLASILVNTPTYAATKGYRQDSLVLGDVKMDDSLWKNATLPLPGHCNNSWQATASRDDSLFGTHVSKLTQDWKNAVRQTISPPDSIENDLVKEGALTPPPADSSSSSTPLTSAPESVSELMNSKVSSPHSTSPTSKIPTTDDLSRWFQEGNGPTDCPITHETLSFDSENSLEKFPPESVNKPSVIDLHEAPKLFSKCIPPNYQTNKAAITTGLENLEEVQDIDQVGLKIFSIDDKNKTAAKIPNGIETNGLSQFKRFNKLYSSLRMPVKRNSSRNGKIDAKTQLQQQPSFISGSVIPSETSNGSTLGNPRPSINNPGGPIVSKLLQKTHQHLNQLLNVTFTPPASKIDKLDRHKDTNSQSSMRPSQYRFIQDANGRLSISAITPNKYSSGDSLTKKLNSSFRRTKQTTTKSKLNNTLDVLTPTLPINDISNASHCVNHNIPRRNELFGKFPDITSKSNMIPQFNPEISHSASFHLQSPVSIVFDWVTSVCSAELYKLETKRCQISPTLHPKAIVALGRKFNFDDFNPANKFVHETNVTSSGSLFNVEKFRDGLIFCTIIEHYLPGKINLLDLDPSDIDTNNQKAYKVIDDLGIIALIEPREFSNLFVPLDKLAVITYLYQLKTYFERQFKDDPSPALRSFDEAGNDLNIPSQKLKDDEKKLNKVEEIVEQSNEYLKRNSALIASKNDLAIGPTFALTNKPKNGKKDYTIEQVTENVGFPIVHSLPKPLNASSSIFSHDISNKDNKALTASQVSSDLDDERLGRPIKDVTMRPFKHESQNSQIYSQSSASSRLSYNLNDPLSKHPYIPSRRSKTTYLRSNTINLAGSIFDTLRATDNTTFTKTLDDNNNNFFTTIMSEEEQILKQRATQLIKNARKKAQLDQLNDLPLLSSSNLTNNRANVTSAIKEDTSAQTYHDKPFLNPLAPTEVNGELLNANNTKLGPVDSTLALKTESQTIPQYLSPTPSLNPRYNGTSLAFSNRSIRLKIKPDFDFQFTDSHVELEPSQFEILSHHDFETSPFDRQRRRPDKDITKTKQYNSERRKKSLKTGGPERNGDINNGFKHGPAMSEFSAAVQKIVNTPEPLVNPKSKEILTPRVSQTKHELQFIESGVAKLNETDDNMLYPEIDNSNPESNTANLDIHQNIDENSDTYDFNICDRLNELIGRDESYSTPVDINQTPTSKRNPSYHNENSQKALYDHQIHNKARLNEKPKLEINNQENIIFPCSLISAEPDTLIYSRPSSDAEFSHLIDQHKELDEKAIAMERELRESMLNKETQRESVLMAEWFNIINTKSDLLRQQNEMAINVKEKELEIKCEQLKAELQTILDISDESKTREDRTREQSLIDQLVKAVDQRDQLVQKLDIEEQKITDETDAVRTRTNEPSDQKSYFEAGSYITSPSIRSQTLPKGHQHGNESPKFSSGKKNFLDRFTSRIPFSGGLNVTSQDLDLDAKEEEGEGEVEDNRELDEEYAGVGFDRRSNWIYNTLVATPKNAFYNSLPRANFMRNSLRVIRAGVGIDTTSNNQSVIGSENYKVN